MHETRTEISRQLMVLTMLSSSCGRWCCRRGGPAWSPAGAAGTRRPWEAARRRPVAAPAGPAAAGTPAVPVAGTPAVPAVGSSWWSLSLVGAFKASSSKPRSGRQRKPDDTLER
jgi:hypothetical protein